MEIAASILTSFGLGAPAAATAAAGGTAAAAGTAAAFSGSTLASILQGTATLFSVASAFGAGNQESESLNLQAADADREQGLETLQGIERRSSIKKALVDAVGAQDVAYAASGVDLSFGTPSRARSEAFREADFGIGIEGGTEMTRYARLSERASSLRAMAKKARAFGILKGITTGLEGGASILRRG